MNSSQIIGTISVVIALVAYVPYVVHILRKETKPHAYSWLTWTLLALIAFAVQIKNGGGAGSWLMGVTMLASFVIFLMALKQGEKKILLVDRLSLGAALVALLLWGVTYEPFLAILLITVADAVGGFFPTFRKSFHKPLEETASIYMLYVISLTLSLVALDNRDLTNLLYPMSLILLNGSLALFLLIRRRQKS